MNTESSRRMCPRVSTPGGSAWCLGDSRTAFEVVNASMNGVGLQAAGEFEVGQQVDLELWWPRVGAATATAVVTRVDRAHDIVGLRYTRAAGLTHLVRQLFLIENARRSAPSTIFCGDDPTIMAAVEKLREEGYSPVHALSLLDAIQRIEDPWQFVGAAVFSCVRNTDRKWTEFAEHLHSEESQVQLIHLGSTRSLVGNIDPSLFDYSVPQNYSSAAFAQLLGLQKTAEFCLSCDAPIREAQVFCSVCHERSRDLGEYDDLGIGD